ncbi:hypothetical protein [Staphylococcus equorum]|uniref:Uncharacterized protein n=1 Tax=Staphylococcus equorum TaxID=246432 RepID=A0A9X4LGK0_9STAP|nr:hypothetical protein [Staphylococcus equorum]MDG0860380.1 hypothetical protein [Staphylococcus equorum]
MTRLLKCYGYCNSKYPKEELKKLNLNKNSTNDGHNYCVSCYEKKIKDFNDRNDLYKFLQDTFDLNFPTGLMLRQIKQFNEERGYSYKNIRLTLNYIFNIKRCYKPMTKFGIAMVPHFHEEMIEYYKNFKNKRENLTIKKTETKRVTLPLFETNESYKQKKLINMEDLIK